MGGMPGAYPPGGVAPGMAPGMGAPYGAGVPGMHPGAAAPGYHPGAPAAGMMNSVGGGRRVYHITVAAMGLKARRVKISKNLSNIVPSIVKCSFVFSEIPHSLERRTRIAFSSSSRGDKSMHLLPPLPQ